MISQSNLARRIARLEDKSLPAGRAFIYSARDGDIDQKRSATIGQRCCSEFKYIASRGDVFIVIREEITVSDGLRDPNFAHDFTLKINGVFYNEGWPPGL